MKKAGELDKKLGRNIVRFRMSSGFTRKDLAVAIGVTHQQLQKYELGINRISVSRLFDMATALKLPVTKLIDIEGATPQGEFDSRHLGDIINHVNKIHDKTKLDAIRNLVRSLSVGEVVRPVIV